VYDGNGEAMIEQRASNIFALPYKGEVEQVYNRGIPRMELVVAESGTQELLRRY
jgi:hypothetical protein